jgi:acyl carrier protein
MQSDDVRNRVKAVLAREWRVAPETIGDDAALNHCPQWDSLGHITILLALQAEFGFELTADTIQQLVSLPRIVEHLQAAPVAG